MPNEDRKKQQKAVRMVLEQTAERFRALGDPTRLQIIQYLRAWEHTHSSPTAEETTSDPLLPKEPEVGGASVTEICKAVTGDDKISSTFSHHLKELRHAGLIAVERHGKSRWYRMVPEALESVVPYVCGTPSIVETAVPVPEEVQPTILPVKAAKPPKPARAPKARKEEKS